MRWPWKRLSRWTYEDEQAYQKLKAEQAALGALRKVFATPDSEKPAT